MDFASAATAIFVTTKVVTFDPYLGVEDRYLLRKAEERVQVEVAEAFMLLRFIAAKENSNVQSGRIP